MILMIIGGCLIGGGSKGMIDELRARRRTIVSVSF